jgi:low temperature requirement protein LtrA
VLDVPAAATGELYQLIVIVALGEALIGLGLGSVGIPLSTVLVVVSVLGIVIIAALWWAYFEVLVPAGERALHGSSGTARPVLARDAYSLPHPPVLAGIVLFALKTLGTAEHFRESGTRTALDQVTVGARRVMGQASRLRMGASVLLAALAPVGALVPALVGFGMLAVVAVAVVAVEFKPHTALYREFARLAHGRQAKAEH